MVIFNLNFNKIEYLIGLLLVFCTH